MKKRSKPKATPERIESGPDTPDPLKANPGTISAQELCSWTGLSDRHHRRIAAEGFYPPPLAGQYQMTPTLQGLFKYFRTLAKKKSGTLAVEKELKFKAERGMAELRLAQARGELRSAKEIADSLFQLEEENKSTLSFKLIDQLPQLNDGLGAAEQRANNRKAFLEICKRNQEWSEKWKA